MPIQRFRSHEEAERALWLPAGDPSILSRLSALLLLSRRLAPLSAVPRGVQKFRSIDEAQAAISRAG